MQEIATIVGWAIGLGGVMGLLVIISDKGLK